MLNLNICGKRLMLWVYSATVFFCCCLHRIL